VGGVDSNAGSIFGSTGCGWTWNCDTTACRATDASVLASVDDGEEVVAFEDEPCTAGMGKSTVLGYRGDWEASIGLTVESSNVLDRDEFCVREASEVSGMVCSVSDRTRLAVDPDAPSGSEADEEANGGGIEASKEVDDPVSFLERD